METNIPKLKIILLGDSGVGKSSIINQYVFKKFQQKGTVDFPEVLSKQLEIDENNVILQILDTNGQERHGGSGLGATFFNDAKGCMLVYDVNDSKSFDNLENWLNEFITKVMLRLLQVQVLLQLPLEYHGPMLRRFVEMAEMRRHMH